MNKSALTILMLSVALLIVACGQATPDSGVIRTALAETQAAQPPTIPDLPWDNIEPTLMPINIPLQTSTPYPTYTPEIPIEVLDPLFDEKQPGVYLIGVDIAPGVWRSQAEGDDCFWMTMDVTGESIRVNYGFAGGTMYIATTDFSVEMGKRCGSWVFLQAP